MESLEREFGSRTAAWDLRRYRRRGPLPSSRLLIESLEAEGVGGCTLIDVGAGVGAVTHALLQAGVSSATLVDASSAYLQAVAEEAERQGHRDRIALRHGDAVRILPRLPAADAVTLDRVICCYPDLEGLLNAALAASRRLVGLVFPRERWWVRVGVEMANLTYRLRRCGFRAYVHPIRAIERILGDQGFVMRANRSTFLWEVRVYARANDG